MGAGGGTDDPFIANYHMTDRDVPDYTDHVKSLRSSKLTKNASLRYRSSKRLRYSLLYNFPWCNGCDLFCCSS